jgi:hypothetical protein
MHDDYGGPMTLAENGAPTVSMVEDEWVEVS